jgi:O-antigen/teichoic acid export membrane protein
VTRNLPPFTADDVAKRVPLVSAVDGGAALTATPDAFAPASDTTDALSRASWRRVAKGSATALLTRGTGVALSMVTAIVTARALGPEGKGILAFLSTITALAARAGGLGLDGSFAHFHLVRQRTLEACLGAAAVITIVSGVAAGAVCELLVIAVPAMRAGAPPALAAPFFAAMPAYFVLFISTFVFFALGRETWFGMFDVGYRAAMLGGMSVALLWLNGTVRAAVWVQIVVGVLFAVAAAVAAGRVLRWRLEFDRSLIAEMLHQGAPYYWYGLVRYALCYGGVLLAGLLLSAADAGLFAVSLMLGEGMILFAGAVNLAFYPAVALTNDRRKYTATMARRIAVLSVVMAVMLGLAAAPLVRLVYGAAFAPAVLPFLLLLPGLVLLTIEQVLSSYYAARAMPWRIVMTIAAGCVLALAGAVPASRAYGLRGLALAIGVTQALVSLAVLQRFVTEPVDSRA